MKNLKVILAILFIGSSMMSCGNEEEATAQNQLPTSNYFFKAKIDGAQYETDAAFRVFSSSGSTRINIKSVLSDNRNFELQIDRPIGIGTYTYPTPSGVDYVLRMEYADATSATAVWKTGTCSGTTGTLTITALSTTEISGNFSFTGQRTSFCSDRAKLITEGSFKSLIIQ
jgi:hypothetical protein